MTSETEVTDNEASSSGSNRSHNSLIISPKDNEPTSHNSFAGDNSGIRIGASASGSNRSHNSLIISPKDNEPTSHNSFSGDNAGLQIGVNRGTINLGVNHYSSSLFASFTSGIQDTPENRSATRLKIKNRARFQHGRRPPKTIEYYTPYPTIQSKEIKRQLVELFKPLHFFDCAIAEYFQVAGSRHDQEDIQDRLHEIRQKIIKRQGNVSDQSLSPESIYLGDLGSFFENVVKSWTNPHSPQPVFNNSCQSDEQIFQYIQDALEVHYWELSLHLFSEWRQKAKSLTEDLVIRIIESVKHEILIGRSRLVSESKSGQSDITYILRGIDIRIELLDSVRLGSSPNSDRLYDLIMKEQSQSQVIEGIEESTTKVSKIVESKKETVTLMVLILIFLIVAIIPWSKAFAISWKAGGKGSTEDADFWYLIQSSIMSVLGNLIMVVPLMKKSWLSPAYTIYPFYNTGWSSMASFFGSIASVSSVLVMTQDIAQEGSGMKVKVD
ncbi:uncharacterized protein TRIVIDRAFT_226465 [Trichoderma virens Gv29-8]|uniref:Fungal death-pathway protein SesB domain-containing protein n=1 Tax=Hypocrea virens (strain Gv29-8 / FGSC 10586) TaxID=413071 RepID=G9N706_HYPVG|nr:uncharacterized protein TRIVIDRAFT_226465 [Trichoderma virens Gv29-8]EHK17504.1 hypothetical protein TRIVIDRAFT_226465 [Trichoderma virens Gv29-8]UKZ53775.1 hypothetical protein TrVGV298_007575 [Trichoderma virens]